MDLETLKDSFEKVAEKQKQSAAKSEQLIDQLITELNLSISQLQNPQSDQSSILAFLNSKISQIAPLSQLESAQKDLNLSIAKYLKTLEKSLTTDISKAYRDIDMDPKTLNEIIASHFYRLGEFTLGDSFCKSADVADSHSLKSPFIELHQILQSVKSHDLQPAISWADKNRESNSHLLLKLHRFQFLEILKTGNRDSALLYARTHLSQFAAHHKSEIQKLIACLLWTNRLDQSPYATSLLPAHYSDLASEISHHYCQTLNQPNTDPLTTVISAGSETLPTLLKLAAVMGGRKEEWKEMKQLPVPMDLGREYQYHSVFVCPVLREQAGGQENPPMLMPCGHVLSKQSIGKLSKNSTRGFKCPYCPAEASVGQCRQLYF